MILYLIAHKVRGTAAFDVAERCDEMGTPSDPGPWWIIPTSGRRAYPYFDWPLEQIVDADCGQGYFAFWSRSMPDSLPDHYAVNKEPPKAPESTEALMRRLKL